MKIYKSNYRDHWISPYTVLEYVFFWTAWSKCGRNKGVIEDKDYVDHPAWVVRATNYIDPVCQAVKWVLDLVHPQINYIKIDRYDTWSMDHTLSDIILPMLKQLKKTKHGSPFVDDEDVPEYLRSHMAQPKEYEWDTDSLHHQRWDWALDEMIWAFEQKVADDAEGQFYEHEEWDELPATREERKEWIKDINERLSRTKYDEEGHRAWLARKTNGLRLFGKYYEALWD
jgi:hypothetical protein